MRLHNDVERPVFIDPFVFPKPNTALASLADEIGDRVGAHFASLNVKRVRSETVGRRLLIVENLAANLCLQVLSPDYRLGQRLAVPTAKTKEDRYTRTLYGKRLVGEVTAAFAAAAQVDWHPYKFREKLTTLSPNDGFLAELKRRAVTLDDLAIRPGGEPLILSARLPLRPGEWGAREKELVDYAETTETLRLRGEMVRINSVLTSSDLRFDAQPMGPVFLRRTFLLRKASDPREFRLNGRMAGAWWLNLSAKDRHRITLGGEPVVDLDFKAMFVQLAYRRQGSVLSDAFDPYLLPGLENHRDGAKKAMLALLGRSTQLRAISPELKALLPEGWDARRLREAAYHHHSDIRGLFGKDVAVELMFVESQILVAVLLRLASGGIPALPMHDGIMVPRSSRTTAIQTMVEVSASLLDGSPLPVVEKSIPLA